MGIGVSATSDRAKGALLGAAFGDAAGWPYEPAARRIDKKDNVAAQLLFQWTRRGGTRFLSYEEPIGTGEYSDDTQLSLSTARSLLHGEGWWRFFTTVELPTWTIYQRGGGASLLASSTAWATGQAPWEQSPEAISKYFNSGGNGVVMRIIPHSLVSPEHLNEAVCTNGIATHGHPRALIGALIQANVVRACLMRTGTLAYGELAELACDLVGEWLALPELPGYWLAAAERATFDYERVWKTTSEEATSLLQTVRNAMAEGSVALDQAVLKELGAVGRDGRAGTSTAAAALFLASRYAAEPISAIAHIARFPSADTDTLASMVGGILGALYGTEWLKADLPSLQDHTYIADLAEKLNSSNGPSSERVESISSITRRRLDEAIASLQDVPIRGLWHLPDGRDGEVTDRRELRGLTAGSAANCWRVRLFDGQSLAITRGSRVSQRTTIPPTERRHSNELGQVKMFTDSNSVRKAASIPDQSGDGWRKRPTPEDAYDQVAKLSFDPTTFGRHFLDFLRRGSDGYGVALSFASLVAKGYRSRHGASSTGPSEDGIKRDIRQWIDRYFQDVPLRRLEHQALVELLFRAGMSPATKFRLDVKPSTKPNGGISETWELSMDPLNAYKIVSDGTQSTLELIRNTLEQDLVPTVRSWKVWHELRPEPTGR